MFDARHPWFRPLWRRVLLVALTFGWGTVELASGNDLWALVFYALGGWVIWALIVTYPPVEDGDDKDGAA